MRAVRTVALTFVLALALAVPASAQDDPIFTVTAPSGVYTASQAVFDHWLDIARRASGGPGARAQVFQLLTSLVWVEGEAAEQGIVVTASTRPTPTSFGASATTCSARRSAGV